ncbi:MAG: nucleotidyltransferase domain-containing protein [Dehalococcoidales bacterium]|jgi:predicted nucleotidyltransferase|nr:nucleotidyltransferase domain-containing protein [Dehalococcoidales bacterium]HNR44816.1 nucleotidyltransferase domain-containing protein [Methanofastidiosum sp.]HNU62010.1 nucleotidyltransferase domain-containing protein [Methanofastidiosum sp.]
MDINLDKELGLIKKIKGFDHVRFIFLYGSTSTGNANKNSDIDLCIYYEGPENEASRFRLKVLSELSTDKYDVKIFQQLPLYIRKEVLKGRLLYSKDFSFVHEVALDTIREFDYFKRFYYDYIGLEMIT